MKLKYLKDIKENTYSITVKCSELGTETMDVDTEKNLIENFIPQFKYHDLSWTGKFGIDEKGNIIADEAEGDTISIGLIDKLVLVNENLEVTYTVSIKSIKPSMLKDMKKITTSEKYCEACCLLFKTTIKKAVKDCLDSMRKKNNDFESEEDSDII
ncbi:hypothetical protein [Clostridium botulinum]|uniref:hypothetical protein n=1 Tax=Clostridium botulinum TaxID=1491 RepID=UPI001C9B7508|nr:hypothetical protein [Clostridium botulinum]MBY6838827.1 hypothetical protein [Clostridium botulinum]